VPLLALAALVVLTVMVVTGSGIVTVDHQVQRWMIDHYRPKASHAASSLTEVLSPTVDVVLLALYGLVRGRRTLLPALSMILILAVVVLGMKYGFDRVQPDGARPARGDYPSGHTASVLICGGTAVVLSRLTGPARPVLWAAVAAATAAVGTSLLYINAHWLSDVLASVAIGVIALWGLTVTRRANDRRSPS
jgi:undecaprenyl-diphosphatase